MTLEWRPVSSLMPISVIIFTHNDEATLAYCLESVAWSDDVTIVDAASTDRTRTIAQQHGVRIIEGECDCDPIATAGKLRLKHPWVFVPHADELTPARLRDEVL